MVISLTTELLTQIHQGGNRYNMVTATHALVSNMAMEAANTCWHDFIREARKAQLHPSQINGRKHLRTIVRELEGVSNACFVELVSIISLNISSLILPTQPRNPLPPA